MRKLRSFIALLFGVLCLAGITRADPPLGLTDLAGQVHLIPDTSFKATVVVFVGTECPISNHYIPLLNELAAKQNDSVEIFGVISDPTVTRAAAQKYSETWKISFPLLFDASGDLAAKLSPSHTPEVFVFDEKGDLRYRGRIDDAYEAVGKPKQITKSHDLEDAIAALVGGQPIAAESTPAVGCIFEAWGKGNPPVKPTYARDIAPLLSANCIECHRDGEIAPFSLTDFTSAAKRAKQMAVVTADHFMPPWKPARNYGHFFGERGLNDRQIKMLADWADAGAPQGDLIDLPPPRIFKGGWELGEPDIIVKIAEPFPIPAAGKDIYRAFVVPLNLDHDVNVAGIEMRSQTKTILHHCLIYLDNSGQARKLDEKDPGPGYESFGGPGFVPPKLFGGWAPGTKQYLLPDGVGRPVKKGADLVVCSHYRPDGREHSDQFSIGIYLQKKPLKETVAITMLSTNVDIKPGDANYTRDLEVTLPVDMTLITVVPHMHLLGRDMKISATTPDGKIIPLVWIDNWDFKWQGPYRFLEPMKLPKGTVIHLSATFDNSAANLNNPNDPPKQVYTGEKTTDEMCFSFFEFMTNDREEIKAIRTAFAEPKLVSPK